MTYLRMNDMNGRRPRARRPQPQPQPRQANGLGGLGFFTTTDPCQGQNDNRNLANKRKLQEIIGGIAEVDRGFAALKQGLENFENDARTLAISPAVAAADRATAGAAFSVGGMRATVNAAAEDAMEALRFVREGLDKVERIKRNMKDLDVQAGTQWRWGCFYTPTGQGNHVRQVITPMLSMVDEARAALRTAESAANLSAKKRRFQLLQAEVAQRSQVQSSQANEASAAAAAARAASDVAYQRDQDRLAYEREQEAQRRADEDARRQADAAYQQQLRDEERQREQETRQLEAAERNAQQAAEQRRIDAEIRREEMTIQAEQRRIALEQERILRGEERELRKEEREAELQRMMLMQELAAKGIPGMGPSMPQVPGMPMGIPGLPVPPGMPYGMVMPGMAPSPWPGMPQQAPQGYPGMPQGYPGMPQGYPGMPQAPQGYPGMPQAPMGYAATPPQPYQQGGVLAPPQPYQQSAQGAAPQGAAPPGMAWAAFDPGGEMFGMGDMGAMVPAGHPDLSGARIEEGYVISGPSSSGIYTINRLFKFDQRSDGRLDLTPRPLGAGDARPEVWSGDEDRLFGGQVVDPATNQVVFSPGRRPEGVASQVLPGVFATLQEGIRQAGGYLQAREVRRGQGGSSYQPASYDPGYSAQPARSSAGPILIVGALAAGAVALTIAAKRKKKG